MRYYCHTLSLGGRITENYNGVLALVERGNRVHCLRDRLAKNIGNINGRLLEPWHTVAFGVVS